MRCTALKAWEANYEGVAWAGFLSEADPPREPDLPKEVNRVELKLRAGTVQLAKQACRPSGQTFLRKLSLIPDSSRTRLSLSLLYFIGLDRGGRIIDPRDGFV